MYGHTLQFANQSFDEAIPIPKGTTITCTKALRVGNTMGSLGIAVLAADDAVTLNAGKKMTVDILVSDTEDGTFEVPETAVTSVLTAAAAMTPLNGGRIMAQLFPTPCGKWVKVRVGTDDAGATGKIDVALEFAG